MDKNHLKDAVVAEIVKQQDDLVSLVVDYINHVYEGGDPSKMPDDKSSYRHPIASYTKFINNEYRRSLGLEISPFGPLQFTHYKLFCRLVDNDRLGEWVTSKTLRGLAHGSHPTTYLDNDILNGFGFMLERDSGPPVMYRIVKVEVEVPA